MGSSAGSGEASASAGAGSGSGSGARGGRASPRCGCGSGDGGHGVGVEAHEGELGGGGGLHTALLPVHELPARMRAEPAASRARRRPQPAPARAGRARGRRRRRAQLLCLHRLPVFLHLKGGGAHIGVWVAHPAQHGGDEPGHERGDGVARVHGDDEREQAQRVGLQRRLIGGPRLRYGVEEDGKLVGVQAARNRVQLVGGRPWPPCPGRTGGAGSGSPAASWARPRPSALASWLPGRTALGAGSMAEASAFAFTWVLKISRTRFVFFFLPMTGGPTWL